MHLLTADVFISNIEPSFFPFFKGAEIPGPGSYDVISTSTSGNLMGIGLKSGFDRFAKGKKVFTSEP